MDYSNPQPGVKFHCLLLREPLRLLKTCIGHRRATVYRVLQRKLLQVRLIWVELSKDAAELATAIRVKYQFTVPGALEAALPATRAESFFHYRGRQIQTHG